VHDTPILSMLHDRQPIDLIWLSLGSPAIAEIAAQARPGAIVIDMQHGLWDRTTLEAAVGIARHSTRVIVRCADDSPTSIAQALDSGAHSVLIPLMESGRAAAAAASASRYPPQGTRSAGGVRPLLRGVETLLEANREVAVGVMIETVAGVEQASAIAQANGVDYVFIGTGDLAMSRGASQPADIESDCEQVRRVALERGLPCGIFTSSAADAAKRLAAGYALAVVANDIELVKRGVIDARAVLNTHNA
jgi:2-keto-3-deoxy-L-rhamnonate aldolase RhmA